MGLAAIGGAITSIGPSDDAGLHLRIGGDGARTVRVALAPGLLRAVSIEGVRRLDIAAIVPVTGPRCSPSTASARCSWPTDRPRNCGSPARDRPWSDIDACLLAAREAGFFVE